MKSIRQAAVVSTAPVQCSGQCSSKTHGCEFRAPFRSDSAMAGESCHPHSLLWLARSCIPADPDRHIAVPVPIPVPATTNLSSTNPAFDSEESPICSLPDEVILECLARIPRASLPPLPSVCRRFASLLASDAFLHLRRAHGLLRPTLVALAVPSSSQGTFARALLHFGDARLDPKISVLPLPSNLPPHCRSFAFAHACSVTVGRAVFLIGRGSVASRRRDGLESATAAHRLTRGREGGGGGAARRGRWCLTVRERVREGGGGPEEEDERGDRRGRGRGSRAGVRRGVGRKIARRAVLCKNDAKSEFLPLRLDYSGTRGPFT